MRRRGLVRTAARTAVIAGTATSVSGRVARRQQEKFGGHAEPATAGAQQAHAAVQHAPVAESDVVSRLQQLADLKATGILSEKEFAAAKAKVLAG